MNVVLGWRQRILDKCGGSCSPSHQKPDSQETVRSQSRIIIMKFNSTLSVAAITLLYITGSLCQLDVCGRAPLNNRIVGGENATAGDWPWQVSIHLTFQDVNFGHFCGGTLINKDWVLSAAHCFQWFNASYIVMYFGRLNQSGFNLFETNRTARRNINHPNFNISNLDNDVALVQLSSSVTFSDYIRPVCLAAAGSVFGGGTESWVTGWGRLQPNGTQLPDILQEVMIPIVNNSACANAYGGVNISITSNMICAGLLNQGGKGACQRAHTNSRKHTTASALLAPSQKEQEMADEDEEVETESSHSSCPAYSELLEVMERATARLDLPWKRVKKVAPRGCLDERYLSDHNPPA
ncbi:trypsin-like [Sinocyclocheilus anshuiensis]|uniref:trypsin-like n=1 Tax=Sinocyclocheilus anshuiensis TaxID=1608454 RepID=UPI0007B89385|nr:PREDICTED: trypsin-like [Sinocyclocheilus anshuiensis]